MTDDKFSDEILTYDELDGVVGGNALETNVILNNIDSNDAACNLFVQYERDNFPDGGSRAELLTGFLDKVFGIEADINDNFQRYNIYRDKATGESMTNNEVCAKIRNFSG